MSDPKLGQLIAGDADRDAIHVAVAPVVATEQLYPGEHIGFVEEGDCEKVGRTSAPIGIVDPYLRGGVTAGDRFWMFLYQGTVTSLRHHWGHSAFNADTGPHHKWITELASSVGLSYKDMIEGADAYVNRREYIMRGGLLEGESVPKEFWEHYEAVTRKKVSEDKRGSFFSCSC